jgi:hypothetical protein
MIEEHDVAALEFEDIQGPVLRKRPIPYFGAYFILRIDDPTDGRQMLRRLAPKVASAAGWEKPADLARINVAFTFQGLKALGVPQASLESFSPEFQQGMAARAELLDDFGESAPANWEKPFGTQDVHVVLAITSGEEAALEHHLDLARSSQDDLPGVSVIYELDVGMLPTMRTHLGYRDGIGGPAIEGDDSPSTLARDRPSRPESSSSATTMREVACLRCRNLRRWGVTAPTWLSASCTRMWRSSASTCAPTPRPPKKRSCCTPRWWAAGRAAPRWCSPQSATIPSLGPIHNATTTSATTRRTRRASSAQPVPTSAAPTRGMPSKTRSWT